MDEIPDYGPTPGSYSALLSETLRTFDQHEYYRQVHDSDVWFLCGSKTSLNYLFGITPYQFNPNDNTDISVNLSSFAIDTFNEKIHSLRGRHGKLQFILLLNVTSESRDGRHFYLTFKAKTLDRGKTSTYQAIVWKHTVFSFRRKPARDSMKKWIWDDRPCGTEEESGEGVSRVPEPPIINVIHEKYVVDSDVGCSVFEDCLMQRITQFTGAGYGIIPYKSDPSKNIIQLSGTFEQLEKVRPIVCGSITRFKNY